MLVNSKLTVYHKVIENREEIWKTYHYECWWFGGKGTSTNKGYENANDVQIRIPYDVNPKLDYTNFGIGDILVQGIHDDIKSESDVTSERYNITSLNNNVFGINKHIHVSGK